MYRDRGWLLQLFGVVLLAAGGACAVLGPIEIYCFYLFSAGGPFHYEGFGFGSFMFGNLAAQIAGYYLIALLFIPVGYGHVRLRRWARTLGEALLWAWLVLGVPLLILFLAILFSSKDLPPAVAMGALVLVGLSYPLAPILLLRFYRGDNVRRTFESRDPNTYWTERLPVPVLVVVGLCVFYVLVLHAPIFFQGLFPVFGTWLVGLDGITALTAAILCLALLTWGLWRQAAWAWWGALAFFSLLTLSAVVTLAATSYPELLALLNLPPAEMEFLDGIPAQGYHFAAFVGLPLALTLVALAVAKAHFGGPRAPKGREPRVQ